MIKYDVCYNKLAFTVIKDIDRGKKIKEALTVLKEYRQKKIKTNYKIKNTAIHNVVLQQTTKRNK